MACVILYCEKFFFSLNEVYSNGKLGSYIALMGSNYLIIRKVRLILGSTCFVVLGI
jgi:hypothetical protein